MWKRKGKEPPCDTCMPTILPENMEVFNVFQHAKDQVIVSGGRPVAIDYKSLDIVMNMLEVEDKQTVFERVVSLWNRIHFDNVRMEKVRQDARGK
jgi:hypothetical protein